MKNEFTNQIQMIGNVLHHKSKPANQDSNIYKDVSHYSRHIKSLTKELDRAMFTKSELDIILKISEIYLTWETEEEKHLDAIIRKCKSLSKIARTSRYERIK